MYTIVFELLGAPKKEVPDFSNMDVMLMAFPILLAPTKINWTLYWPALISRRSGYSKRLRRILKQSNVSLA
jgi:hypothetical protein